MRYKVKFKPGYRKASASGWTGERVYYIESDSKEVAQELAKCCVRILERREITLEDLIIDELVGGKPDKLQKT